MVWYWCIKRYSKRWRALKKIYDSGKTLTKAILNKQKFCSKKLLILRKKLSLEAKIRTILLNTEKLEYLGMPFEEEKKFKISWKEKGVVYFDLKDFLNSADLLLQKVSCREIECEINMTEEFYKQIRKECVSFVLKWRQYWLSMMLH